MSSTVTTLTDELNNVYPVFEANQVLTSSHLNQLRNYLDTQDRLSRVKLVGVGIVCGLELDYDGTNITISAGTGITSEGFLIQFPEAMVYTKATEADYADPEGYPPFIDELDTVTGQIDMWELLPDSSTVADTLALTTTAINIENKAVVLFMEYEDIDLESCVGQNCDDKGINRQFTVRALLLNCTDVDSIIRDGYGIPFSNADDSSLDGSLNVRFKPDYMAMSAFTLLPVGSDYATAYNDIDYVGYFSDRYADLFPGSGSNSMHDLGEKIWSAYEYYSPILQNLITTSNIENLTTKFNTQLTQAEASGGSQYYYDYSKDLAKAYNEFIDAAFEITAECLPSQDLFPRHLVIGKVTSGAGCPENEDDCKPKVYRTHFIQSPIYNQQKDKLEEVRTKFKRIVKMTNGFVEDYTDADDLKITPSNEKEHELHLRSIPFYFGSNSLYKFWNYNLKKKCKANWNLGYRSADFGDTAPSSLNPLDYNKDAYNFYRIEGILHKPFADVKSDLEDLKRKYDLEFDIMALKLESDGTPYTEDVNCGMIDIKETYLQFRNEVIAETKKYGWLLNKFFYLIMNWEEILADLTTEDPSADPADLTTTDLTAGFSQVQDLVATLPICIEDFDLIAFREAFKEIQEFSFTIAVLFEKIMRSVYTLNSVLGIIMAPMIQNAIERFFLVNYGFIGSVYDLNDILRSHIDVRMQSIHFSYMQRLAQLESKKLFSNFAQNNPGIRHMAGVPAGGTFILVYQNEISNPEVVADFALKGKPCCCEERFEFCEENVQSYPPSAKNVYYFLDDSLDNGVNVEIDVLEFAIDLNVENIDLNEFEPGSTSEFGGGLQRIDSVDRDRAVVQYHTPTFPPGGIDQFEFSISNESGKTDKACVFITRVPFGMNIFENIVSALTKIVTDDDDGSDDSDVDDSTDSGTDSGTDGGTDDGSDSGSDLGIDYGPGYGPGRGPGYGGTTWVVDHDESVTNPPGRGKGYQLAILYGNGIKADTNRASVFIERTKKRYDRLREHGRIGTEPSAEEVKEYEVEIVNEFREGMAETVDEIVALDTLIGETPEDAKFALKHRLLNENKIAERAALLALYEDQTLELLNVIETEGLAQTTDSEMYEFVNKDVRKYNESISVNSGRSQTAIKRFGEKDNLNGVTQELFKTF